MGSNKKGEIINKILESCLFSEYLPSEFNTKGLLKECLENIPSESHKPLCFTMDKFNDYNSRRNIFVPTVISFVDVVEVLYSSTIIDKILNKNKRNKHSLSKIINENNEIKQFSDGYGFVINNDKQITQNNHEVMNDFQNNLKIKLQKAQGCECILHLDISNFYNSIYTHNIRAILHGADWANEQYSFEMQSLNENLDQDYKELRRLDSKIAAMNRRRTHGILTGPRISFIIAESLLTIVDQELEEMLNKKSIDFVRYMDDYDVFIKNANDIEFVKQVFNSVLEKYGLLINDSKTSVEYFLYYVYIDFDSYKEESSDIISMYSKYANLEKSGLQNGAILYFSQNILSNYTSDNMALSLSFSILKNIPKALKSCCVNITTIHSNNKIDDDIEKMLSDMLNEFLAQKKDLECIWVLYTLLKMFPMHPIDNIIKEYQLNDFCLVICLNESKSLNNFEILKKQAKNCGWLLNYELFFKGEITLDELQSNLNLKDAGYYGFLKDKGINFYKLK